MQTLGRRSPVIVVGTRCMSGPRFLDPLWRHNGRSACGSKYPKPVPGDHLPTPGGPGRSGNRKNRKNRSFCENNGNFMKIADFLIFSAKRSIFRLFSENGASRQPGVKMYCIYMHLMDFEGYLCPQILQSGERCIIPLIS